MYAPSHEDPKGGLLTLLTPAAGLLAVHHKGPHARGAPASSSMARHGGEKVLAAQSLHGVREANVSTH